MLNKIVTFIKVTVFIILYFFSFLAISSIISYISRPL